MSQIVIIGSISMDLVMETNRLANQGETVFGERFSMGPGGKGANQAVAVSRLAGDSGNNIYMFGSVGADIFGRDLLRHLEKENINIDFIRKSTKSTGVAQITLYENDNRIIYSSGANGDIALDTWDIEWEIIKTSDLVILQNEIAHEVNLNIAKFCHSQGVKVLYNPAPSRPTDIELLPYITFITPNEYECKELFPNKTVEEALMSLPNKLIITLGSRGVTFYDGDQIKIIPAIPSSVVDTTGAGDTFSGAFAYAIVNNLTVEEGLKFAVIASHLSVQRFGAQGGMPTLQMVKEDDYYEEKWNIE